MKVLFQSEYVKVELDEPRRLVRYTRSSRPFETDASARETFEALGRALDSLPPGDLALLTDVREAVGRNDEAYETILNQHRARLFGRFERRAVVVRTKVGKMQIQRLDRQGKAGSVEVFEDEAAALAFLGVR